MVGTSNRTQIIQPFGTSFISQTIRKIESSSGCLGWYFKSCLVKKELSHTEGRDRTEKYPIIAISFKL